MTYNEEPASGVTCEIYARMPDLTIGCRTGWDVAMNTWDGIHLRHLAPDFHGELGSW